MKRGKKVQLTMTYDPAVLAALDARRGGESRPAYVARLILEDVAHAHA